MVLPPPMPQGPGAGPPPGGGGPPPRPPVHPLQFLPPSYFDLSEEPLEDNPRKRRPPPPSLSTINHRISQVEQYWTPRNKRMDEDLELYRITAHQQSHKYPGEVVTRNTPYAVVEKVANMVGAQTPVIDVVSPKLDQREQSQKVEDLLRFMWDEWNFLHMSASHGPIRRDIAHFLALRGWIAIRVTYDSEADTEDLPVKLMVADPRNVYFAPGTDGGPRHVVHKYEVTKGEVLDEWEEAWDILDTESGEDTDTVEITAYYDKWYHAVLLDGRELKEVTEHGYGFCPWVIVPANGSPVTADGRSNQVHIEDSGVSIFHGMRQSFHQMNKLLSQLATQVATQANPPVAYYIDEQNDTPEAIKFEPGATNYLFYNKERVDLINNSPNPNDLHPLLSSLQDDIEKGGLPQVLWGGGGDQVSGFAIALLSGAARDQLFGIISSMEFGMEMINRMALTLVRDHHDSEIGIIVKDESGRWVGGRSVEISDIEQVGVRNRVKFRDVAPKDRMQMAQMAIALVKEKLISMETARDEYIGIDNPERENERIMNEFMYMDEEAMKEIMVPLSLWRHNPALFQVWAANELHKRHVEELEKQKQEQERQQAMNAGTPPMPGTTPTPGGVPAPMGPGLFDPMQQAQGSAGGGVGQQRQPGISGSSGQVPGGLGVR